MSIRTDRVGRMIQREVADLLQQDFGEASQSLVTVTGVRMTDDLGTAYVDVSVLGADDRQRKAAIARLDAQIRNSRVWTATEAAAAEDAREAFRQALALHLRTRALKWQKMELERDIAEAIDGDDGDGITHLLRALSEVQNELSRLEQQEAIIDGFGVLSGRVRGGK